MKVFVTEECGHYVLDWERLVRRVRESQDQIYVQTARHACTVELHPSDAKDIAVGMMGQPDAAPVIAIAAVPVILDKSIGRRRGVAVIRQCEPPHPTPQDCPYHARTTRRLVSRDIPVSIQMPTPDTCNHHVSYYRDGRCRANVERRTPGGNTVYEECGCTVRKDQQ